MAHCFRLLGFPDMADHVGSYLTHGFATQSAGISAYIDGLAESQPDAVAVRSASRFQSDEIRTHNAACSLYVTHGWGLDLILWDTLAFRRSVLG